MRALVGIMVVAIGAGCGAGASPPGAGRGDLGAYPAGPYGVAEGATIADLAFLDPAGAPRRLGDLRREGGTVILVVTAAGWCGACIEEQPALRDLHGRHAGRGLRILEALFEDADFGPANAALAGTWKQRYGVPFDVVADPSFSLGGYYAREATPMNMVIDAETMEIVRVMTGWDPGAVEALVEVGL